MSLRKTSLVDGEYYHIYNRGNDKRLVFIDDEDRDRFIKLLYLCNTNNRVNFRDDIMRKKIDAWDYAKGENIVSIGAWVLMPNHFHLYVTPAKGKTFGRDGAGARGINVISLFMAKLCTSYTMYFNKKYGKSGSLFEAKFKSNHVADDIQAKYLFSYIHLNPVKLIQSNWKEVGIRNKKVALEYLKKYKWSSYSDYKEFTRKESVVLNKDDFPIYFPKIADFDKEIMTWLLPKVLPLAIDQKLEI